MSIKLVELLTSGFFMLDKGFMVYGKYHGQLYQVQVKALLVEAGDDRILVDTGMVPFPEGHVFQKLIPMQPPEMSLVDQLNQLGLKPEDISLVINTHLHFDHCGHNRLFSNAKFILQKDEVDFAYQPAKFQRHNYIREQFDRPKQFILKDGDYQVVEGITVLKTPGHTPGHQSIILDYKGKKLVYCGDAACIRENIEQRNIPGILWSSYQALESIDKLREISDAYYIYCHDNEQTTLEL